LIARTSAILALLVALVATGSADAAAPGPDDQRVLGPGATRADSGKHKGHYVVRLRNGRSLVTHGPDPKLPRDGLADHGGGLEAGDPERPPKCATDYYQHVLYARPATAPNRYATVKPQLQAIVRRMNAVLNEEALESGNRNADYKVRCDTGGNIEVGQFITSATNFYAVASDAEAAGFNAPNADYTIFLDAPDRTSCGVGSYWPDERPTADNANNNPGGDYGAGYAITYQGCWDSHTPMHENGHNQGAVGESAPYSTGDGGHCRDEEDVMCYSDGGSRDFGVFTRCPEKLRFDCGHDTYFDAAPEPGEYLSDHWNIGSAANRFVASGAPELENGVRLRAVAGAPKTWSYYRVTVPEGASSLKLVLDGPDDGDLDLYVRRGELPTKQSYDCRPASATADERCKFTAPEAGSWYVGVRSRSTGAYRRYFLTATYLF